MPGIQIPTTVKWYHCLILKVTERVGDMFSGLSQVNVSDLFLPEEEEEINIGIFYVPDS